MSMTQRIKAILGLTDEASTDTDEIEQLRELLAEREAELNLGAEYGRPHPNMEGEPTVVFPYSIYNDGNEYGAGAKEFLLPDDGLGDTEAPLVKFVGKRHGIGPDEVDFEALANVEGTTADAFLNDDGDVVVSEGLAVPTDGDSEVDE